MVESNEGDDAGAPGDTAQRADALARMIAALEILDAIGERRAATTLSLAIHQLGGDPPPPPE